jgi:hypothetical protein
MYTVDASRSYSPLLCCCREGLRPDAQTMIVGSRKAFRFTSVVSIRFLAGAATGNSNATIILQPRLRFSIRPHVLQKCCQDAPYCRLRLGIQVSKTSDTQPATLLLARSVSEGGEKPSLTLRASVETTSNSASASARDYCRFRSASRLTTCLWRFLPLPTFRSLRAKRQPSRFRERGE